MHPQSAVTKRRRWMLTGALALSLNAAACSSSDGGDGATATAETTEAPTTEAPTTAAPTTEAPTTEAPTTEAAPDPIRAAVEAAAGSYTGTWTNTTFGSTGPMVSTIALDGDDVLLDVDLGGFVFGQSDPEPEQARIPLDALLGGSTFESATFGPISVELDATTGSIMMRADDVPAAGIAAFESTATPTGTDSWEGTYVVTFDDATTAEGVFDYARA